MLTRQGLWTVHDPEAIERLRAWALLHRQEVQTTGVRLARLEGRRVRPLRLRVQPRQDVLALAVRPARSLASADAPLDAIMSSEAIMSPDAIMSPEAIMSLDAMLPAPEPDGVADHAD